MTATQAITAAFEKYVVPNYARIPVAIVRGEGSRVWDADGKEYLDLFPGWGVAGLGHCHPRVVAAVREQAGTLLHVANNYYSEPQGRFAQMLSARADGQLCFFANSGAEAAEGAIKLARLHGQPRYKIVTLENSFHGRTFAAITATGQPKYRRGFEPTVPGFSHARINDLASVEALVDKQTCAIMVEPVQGEGGVHACSREFLQGLRDLCDQRELLLIFDEVQTSPARLGTWFGYQHFGVVPDILTSAKAIAGGMPLGVIMATREVAASLKPGTHASTFGGNAIGCAAGAAAFEAIEEEDMLGNIDRLGPAIDELVGEMRDRVGGIVAYRRYGFMIGIELEIPGSPVVQACLERGLLINCTHDAVLRMLPAFNIARTELEQGFATLCACLEDALARRGANAE